MSVDNIKRAIVHKLLATVQGLRLVQLIRYRLRLLDPWPENSDFGLSLLTTFGRCSRSASAVRARFTMSLFFEFDDRSPLQ